MSHILVTGFTPFDGRTVNASWIAARSLAHLPGTRALEIPVQWGSPLQLLEPYCQQDCPHTIIGMGEGRQGWFDIETVARNRRNERPDNDGNRPCNVPILAGGTARLDATIDAHHLQRHLVGAGVPARVSGDAGGFLCEELLYTLETLKTRHQTLRRVLFVHLPPHGTELTFEGAKSACGDALLDRFAKLLHEAVLSSPSGHNAP